MSKLPHLTGKQVVTALQRAGFVVVRTRGSHHVLKHADGRLTVVPVNSGEQIGPGLLRRILTDCELSPDDLDTLR